jgi:DNA-directed RNA polymerase subunit RPC12/RpoP
MALLSGHSIHDEGARFEVICKRCKKVFVVIRNWGGGLRNANDENKNPAECPECGSMKLDLY